MYVSRIIGMYVLWYVYVQYCTDTLLTYPQDTQDKTTPAPNRPSLTTLSRRLAKTYGYRHINKTTFNLGSSFHRFFFFFFFCQLSASVSSVSGCQPPFRPTLPISGAREGWASGFWPKLNSLQVGGNIITWFSNLKQKPKKVKKSCEIFFFGVVILTAYIHTYM